MITGNTFYFPWEVSVIVFLQSHMNSFGLKAATLATLFGESAVIIVILGYIYWGCDKDFGKSLGNIMVTANTICPMIKNLAFRRRPYFDNSNIKCLKPVDSGHDIYNISAQGFSFPSGHSMNSVALFTPLSLALGGIRRIAGPGHNSTADATDAGPAEKISWYLPTIPRGLAVFLSIFLPLAVGVSRFILGVHYPTDVLTGWTIGLIMVFLVPWLEEKFTQKWKYRLLVSVIGVLGFFFCKTTDYYSAYGLMVGFFAGCEFEERFVDFANTRSYLTAFLRLAGGIAVFLLLNTVLKMPFSNDFLESATTAAFLVRSLHYAIILFIMIGVYPMVFRKIRVLS